MLRVLGLALLLAVGAAAPAKADSKRPDDAIAVRHAAVGLPADLTMARPSWRGGGFHSERHSVDRPGGPTNLISERRRHQGWLGVPWLSQGKSGLTLLATQRLALGVGYSHVSSEDLWPEFADTGSIGYESHNFLLRARWRF